MELAVIAITFYLSLVSYSV